MSRSSWRWLPWTITFLSALMIATTTFAQQYAPLLEDNTAVLDVPGRADVDPNSWGDSYSIGSSCYCASSFDHDIGQVRVQTPLGQRTIRQICDVLGDGSGGATGRPRYNDIQCGNGPANTAGDETTCPGRIEYGQMGCKYIGPQWNFDRFAISKGGLFSRICRITPMFLLSLVGCLRENQEISG